MTVFQHTYHTGKRSVKEYLGETEGTPPSVSVWDWLREGTPSAGPAAVEYLRELFPFTQWVFRYNLTWFFGDIVAGVTVGMVLVPQSISYAGLARLPPEYGLYSSFIGVLTYAFFATSKDVSIGPVAVMSLQTGRIITEVQQKFGDEFTAPQIATALAFMCGFVVLGIGLLRLGWLVEFIPQPAVAGFMTGSALKIAFSQLPAVLGLSDRVDNRAETYRIVINVLKNLPYCQLDAAFGVTGLAMLYFIKWSLEKLPKRYPKLARPAFFAQALRHAFVVILFTIISWRINVGLDEHRISLVGYVPSGLRHVGQPVISARLIGAFGPQIPVATIVLLLEHIAIAKSFGRVNGYKINPNQELVAIGFNNTFGTLFQAYPSTGSFSRSALKSKSGVRTPAGGIPTGIVVIIALYAVAPAFYWIPQATLSALIIHAVADLVASPKQSYSFWRISPVEYFIFVGAVLWSVFYNIEAGIYWSLVSSVALLLFRVARPKGHFLGRVRIRPENVEAGHQIRDVYVPLEGDGGVTNRDVPVEAPPPGVIIYRFEESFLYPNASYINDRIITRIKSETRRGKDLSNTKPGDRPWNDPAPSGKDLEKQIQAELARPRLRAVVLDFAGVAQIDTTGVQNLVDTRKEVEKWSNRPVDFHFCGILSPWIRRALIAAGFGIGRRREGTVLQIAPVVPQNDISDPQNVGDYSPASTSSSSSRVNFNTSGLPLSEQDVADYDRDYTTQNTAKSPRDIIGGDGLEKPNHTEPIANPENPVPQPRPSNDSERTLHLLDMSTPFFHFDLADAVNSLDLSSEP